VADDEGAIVDSPESFALGEVGKLVDLAVRPSRRRSVEGSTAR
jgi:hypothetical protein